MKHFAFGFLIVLLQVYNTLGYEIATHEQLSREAVDASVLTDSAFQSHLGLKPPRDSSQTFPNYKPSDGLRTVLELVQDGSKYEDNDIRARAHFFNPLNGQALFNLPGFIPSPDWTLEDKGNVTGQDDSFKDTHQFFFEALTLSNETDRKKKWGRTFQGLGQVIHHLQDMAQPEHSRADPHLTYTPEGFPVNGPGEDPSRYEKYSREKGDICTAPISPPALPPLPSPCAPYGSVHFDTARQFWLTKEDGPDRGTGAGIAEFTNNNFVSKDTNFIDDALAPGLVETRPGYPFPNGTGARIEVKEFQKLGIPPIGTSVPIMPSPLAGKLYFIGTPVRDAYASTTEFNDRTSTFSIYEPDLKRYSLDVEACNPNNDPPTSCRTRAIFTLNTFNFDAAHQFLVKRAIAYSAGMVNYFFRGVGQMDLVRDTHDPTRYLLQNLSDETLNGTFALYYDDQDDNRHKLNGAEWTVTVPARGQVSLPAYTPPSPSDPTPKKPGEYLLVFKGTMGQEAEIAVAATKIYPPAPESFLFDHQYSLILDQANQWALAQESDLQYGTENWVGEAGVLSYDGPTVTSSAVTYGNTIYRGGRVLAVAPAGYQVLAAALQEDPITPQQHLVAILRLPSETGESATGSVWVKALTGTHREWQQQFDLDLTISNIQGWRFNQAGTKACTVGSRPTSYSCTTERKYFGSYEYETYACTGASEYSVVEVNLGSGALTEQNLGTIAWANRSDNPDHLYQFYSGTAGIAADYRNNVLSVATSTSTSEDEHDGSLLKGIFPYWQRSSYSQTLAIDGTPQLSSSGTREENWRWVYTESRWEGSGTENWTEAGFAALDLRGPWFVYTTLHRSGTATSGPEQWNIQSSFELGTNRDGVLDTSNGAPSNISWALDRQENVAFSIKLETSPESGPIWINRLNDQDLNTLTRLTGEIPAIGVR